jgi:hypothetical protein
MRLIFSFSVIAALVLLSACSTKNNSFRDQYRWLSGQWKGYNDGTTMIESWKWEKYRFEGTGVEIIGNDTVFSETMYIESFGDQAAYVVIIKDRSPIMFHRVEESENRLVFVNEHNDFPSQIIYQHESDTALTVSLMAKGRPDGAEVSYQMTRTK